MTTGAAAPDRRLDRRDVVTRLVPGTALALAVAGWAGERPAGAADRRQRRPLALVYRGKAGCTDCSQAVRTMLERDPTPYRVRYCGPGQEVPVTARALAAADLYVQPGGGTDLEAAWKAVRPFAGSLRRWVSGGGSYVGICMGGFLAGFDPGYGLLPGDSGEYATTPGATVHGNGDALVTVRWRGHDRSVYFQGGPCFSFRPDADVTVLATYPNGRVAAAVARHGAGSVGVVGPHPEAPARWYREADLHPVETDLDLGFDLVRTTVAASAARAGGRSGHAGR